MWKWFRVRLRQKWLKIVFWEFTNWNSRWAGCFGTNLAHYKPDSICPSLPARSMAVLSPAMLEILEGEGKQSLVRDLAISHLLIAVLFCFFYLVLSLGNPSTPSHKSFSPIEIINWFLWHSCVWHHQLQMDMLEAFWRSFLILIQSFKSWFCSHPA